jgi:hypothetical protein
MKLLLLLSFLSIIVFFGCSSDTTSSGGSNNTSDTLTVDNLKATVSDYGDLKIQTLPVSNAGLSFIIKASLKGKSNMDSLIIALQIPKSSQSAYSVDVATTDNSLIEFCIQQPSGTCLTYRAYKAHGSGTITISEITSDGLNQIMHGTFSGTLPGLDPAPGSKTIVNGEFKVKLP